jgi:hypothetical protein
MSRSPSPPSSSVGGRPTGSVAASARPALRPPHALRPLVVLGTDTCHRGPSSSLAKRWRPPSLLHFVVASWGSPGEKYSE